MVNPFVAVSGLVNLVPPPTINPYSALHTSRKLRTTVDKKPLSSLPALDMGPEPCGDYIDQILSATSDVSLVQTYLASAKHNLSQWQSYYDIHVAELTAWRGVSHATSK